MSLTIMSGCVSCIDKTSRSFDPQCIKRSGKIGTHYLLQNVISMRESRTEQTLLRSGSSVAVETEKDQTRRFSPTSTVYWLRLGAGILAGILYNVLLIVTGLQGIDVGTLGMISVGVSVYAVTVIIVKYVLGYGPTELKGPNKPITHGIGTFIIWTLFTTILLYTIWNGPHLSPLQ